MKVRTLTDDTQYTRVRRNFIALLLVIGCLLLMAPPQASQAHGGIIIDTSFTDQLEWLVSIDPFPTLMGDAMLTLLVYDIATYDPMNDLTIVVYLAAPDAPQPCCQPGTHRGPIALTIDPALYPGDYSSLVTLDQPGDWEIQFVATAGEGAGDSEEKSLQSFTVIIPLTVNATMGGSERIAIEPNTTPDVDATATVFAQNVTGARQSSGPLDAAPNSPFDGDAESNNSPAIPIGADRGTNWWLWGGLALIPVLLIGWLILCSSG